MKGRKKRKETRRRPRVRCPGWGLVIVIRSYNSHHQCLCTSNHFFKTWSSPSQLRLCHYWVGSHRTQLSLWDEFFLLEALGLDRIGMEARFYLNECFGSFKRRGREEGLKGREDNNSSSSHPSASIKRTKESVNWLKPKKKKKKIMRLGLEIVKSRMGRDWGSWITFRRGEIKGAKSLQYLKRRDWGRKAERLRELNNLSCFLPLIRLVKSPLMVLDPTWPSQPNSTGPDSILIKGKLRPSPSFKTLP